MEKQRALWIALVVVACCLQAWGADKYTDENIPYEFGFNIEGEQHRHEKKDENGLIMGEFGFITADGVYHVTVYATDENGNFRILSMKNIRVKPYPTAPVPQSRGIDFPPSASKPALPVAQAPAPPSPPATLPALPEPSPARSCSSCSLPTTTTQAPRQLADLAVVSRDDQQFPPYPNQPSNPRGRQIVSGQNESLSPVQPSSVYVLPRNDNEIRVNNGQPNQSDQPGQTTQAGQLNTNGGQQPQPGQFGKQGGQLGQQQGQFGQQPGQFGQQPEHFGQQHVVFGQQSNSPQQGGQQFSAQPSSPQYPLDVDSRFSQNNQGNPSQSTEKPQLLSAQMRVVDRNTDINKLGPGEREGLPEGLDKDDMLQLLYTFNYTVGFHGHHEEGYTNGVKKGYYFVTGRDGVRTRIDYVADSEGFHPKISNEVLDLLSDDVPKPETEKDEKFGLKGYEFKWIYFPPNSRR